MTLSSLAMASESSSSSSVLRIAVTNTVGSGQTGSSHLLRLPESTSIGSLVQHLAVDIFGVDEPEQSALAFDNNVFVTEQNRHKIRNGDVLKLAPCAAKIVRDLHAVLDNHVGEESRERSMRLSAFNGLAKLAADDAAVANVIVDNDDLVSGHVLRVLVQEEESDAVVAALALINALGKSFGQVYEKLTNEVVSKIAKLLNNDNLALDAVRVLVETLTKVLASDEDEELIDIIAEDVEVLLKRDSTPFVIQGCSLINHLFDVSSLQTRRRLRNNLMKEDVSLLMILNNLASNETLSGSIERQLILVQRLIVLEYNELARQRVEGNVALDRIKELRQLAFPTTTEPPRRPSDEYTLLGFSTPLDPTQQLNEHVPPGYLALHLLHHLLGRPDQQLWTRAVEDKSQKWFSLAKMCLETSAVLANALVLHQKSLHPLLFSSETPLEDLFVCLMEHAYSAWHSADVSVDFSSFMSTFKEALALVLSSSPSSTSTLSSNLGSHVHMVELVREEARRRHKSLADNWDNKRSVQLLKEHLRAEMFELVVRQRIRFMEQGSIFVDLQTNGALNSSKTNTKSSQKIFCKLSRNHKNILYGPVLCNENNENGQNDSNSWTESASVSHKLSLSDVKHFACTNSNGRDSKSKNLSSATGPKHVLTLTSESGLMLRLAAPNSRCFDLWCDGLHALMQQEMQSQRAQEDLDMLLNIEIKIRLLELEGQDIPNEPPPIPALPKDFDFV